MRYLVCGGRNLSEKLVCDYLLMLPWEDDDIIIHGAATGADTGANMFAYYRNLECHPFKAEWSRFGKSAGHLRNTKMLVEGKPDVVIAFSGKKGTENMIKQAREAGIPVRFINFEDS